MMRNVGKTKRARRVIIIDNKDSKDSIYNNYKDYIDLNYNRGIIIGI